MKQHKLAWIALIAALLLTACGMVDTTGSDTTALSGRIEGPDLLGGTMAVRYPEGWTATMDGLGGIQLASSPALLSAASAETLPDGEVAMLISIASKTTTDGSQPSAQSVLNGFMSQLTASGTSGPTFSAAQSVTIAGSSGLQSEGSSQDDSLGLIVLERERYFLVVMALVTGGDYSAQQTIIEAITASFEYTGP